MNVLKAQDVTFEYIKKLIGNSLSLHEWNVDNGAKIKAQIKVTYSNGLVKTAYLHTTMFYANGTYEYFREQKTGKFKFITGGKV